MGCKITPDNKINALGDVSSVIHPAVFNSSILPWILVLLDEVLSTIISFWLVFYFILIAFQHYNSAHLSTAISKTCKPEIMNKFLVRFKLTFWR